MQRIVPNIWFDHTAAEAAAFYADVFPDGRIVETVNYPTEGLLDFQQEFAGLPLSVTFELGGYRFVGINAGPEFPVNPSVSFMLHFAPGEVQRLDALYDALLQGGQALMPLDTYEFSPRFGWVADKYGVTWQLMLATDDEPRPFVMPSMLFTELAANRAGEAIAYWTDVFGGTARTIARRGDQDPGGPAGSVMYGEFELLGQRFTAMDSGMTHGFTFTPGVSLMVSCDGQEEIDRLWAALSAVPDAEQCGWCADRFGLSWQLVPSNLEELMATPGSYEKLMGMKKIEISAFG